MLGKKTDWQFFVDRGGTFTDVIALGPDGQVLIKKLLSVSPAYEDAVVKAVADVLATSPQSQALSVRMGTTVATNALLERQGEPTVFLTNSGFGDAVKIGYQNRPDIFALEIVLPEMLYGQVIELNCRQLADGKVLAHLDEAEAERALKASFDYGLRSLAICLLHGYRYPEQERQIKEIARRVGFEQISTSHETSALIRYVSRAETTIADAYLSPVLKRYTDLVSRNLGNCKLHFMQSSGGLVEARNFKGKDSLLSGPAGGIVGAVEMCRRIGLNKIIAFDMGGTSTDVSHFDGQYERTLSSEIAGVRMRAPTMDIHTVAAGGGSIVQFDGTRLRVGPQSAGALPGPACYGLGGPLTITDCNLLLGRIDLQFFPRTFGPNRDQSPDFNVVKEKFASLILEIRDKTGQSWTDLQLAESFVGIANQIMASAIKKISTERGHDLSDYVLCAFGGAGPQHACQVAERLGISRVVVPPFAGVLSALGIGLANLRTIFTQSLDLPLEENSLRALEEKAASLNQRVISHFRNEKEDRCDQAERVETVSRVSIRYDGADSSLETLLADLESMRNSFEELHLKRYGFVLPGKALILEGISVEGLAWTTEVADWNIEDRGVIGESDGPFSIGDPACTIIVDKNWRASRDVQGYTLMHAMAICESLQGSTSSKALSLTSASPYFLELFNNLFMSIAEEMGVTLQNTSHSVNIKERLDFSCAVFDHAGLLIANAPHIPVHLGSMGESVQTLIREQKGQMTDGDAFILNNPYNGGTHLPDITVITPIFTEHSKSEPDFFVASRGHHADIGGITPGSMPPNSKELEEEGVVIDLTRIVHAGRFDHDKVLHLFTKAKYPARNPEQNISDLKAQIAANTRGRIALMELVERYGLSVVSAYMGFIRENASQAVRAALAHLKDGSFTVHADDQSKIVCTVKIDSKKSRVSVDFSGTSEQSQGNLNTPISVVRAAVLYVFRTLIKDNIPLNDGCMEPIDLIIPKGSLLNPSYPSAVVAGNVETSQLITDALFGALGVLSACQGTMNNFTFGDDRYQYYETICGGSGAGQSFDGTDAVHTHMTNSRLTDPEVLESRFPVLVKEFSVRTGSGGSGLHRGGNGVVRKLTFLKSMTASILSGRRRVAPFGLNGGGDALTGSNYVIKSDGSRIELSGTQSILLSEGDTFVIETPGGGGFGAGR